MYVCVVTKSEGAERRVQSTIVNVRFTANAYYGYGTSLLSQ